MQKAMKSSNKPGSLMSDLQETKNDIKRLKRGGEAEVSLSEAQQAKRRIKRDILEAEMEERRSMLQELDPNQLPREKTKPKTWNA
jgi:hypothetical protein